MRSKPANARLSAWFVQWRSPLRKFLGLRGRVPRADIDDAAQEVFLRLLRYDKGEVVEHPQAYLYKMAANVAAEWALRARRRYAHEPQWLAGLEADDNPDLELDRRAAREDLRRALAALTGRQRLVLKLRFGEGLSNAEVAARIGSTHRIVKRELAQSYERLRLELDPGSLEAMLHGRE
jgi:RNA polymerase sigma factor (sigma-70 family)